MLKNTSNANQMNVADFVPNRFRPIFNRFRPILDRFRPIFDRFCPGLREIILCYTQN